MRKFVLLIAALLISALSVVQAKYHSRVLFAEVQRLEQTLEAYEVEFGQLQLEQNTLAEHSRIDRLARSRLGMIRPARDSIIYIKP